MTLETVHPSEEVLTSYLLGKLSDAELEQIEQHLAACDRCTSAATAARPRDALTDLLTAAAKDEHALAAIRDATLPGEGTLHALTLIADTKHEDDPKLTAADLDQLPPELLQHRRYRVIRLLGYGGMGRVWLAEHLVLGRMVALKMVRGNLLMNSRAVERFYREIRAAAKLSHPHIATVHDAEQIGGSHFLVMEYVDGHTLAEIVERGPLPLIDACRAIRDASLGLSSAHAAGLVHRDLKPANLMRTTSGATKILDFGLVVSFADGSALTAPNLVMGTPDYIAPEQAEDPRAADQRSDIYSLGCSLYHLLFGRVPFPESSVLRKIDGHRFRNAEPILPLPEALWRVVSRMMAKSPNDRFQSADEVVAALEPFCSAASPELMQRIGDSRSRRKSTIGGMRLNWLIPGIIALLVLFAGGIYWTMTTRTRDSAADTNSPASMSTIPETDTTPVLTAWTRRLDGHRSVIRGVRFSPDSAQVLTCCDDGHVRFWNVATGELLGSCNHCDDDGNPVRIFGMTLTDQGRTLLSSQDDRVRVWDTTTYLEKPIVFDSVVPDSLAALDADSDGLRVAAGSTSGNVRVWEIATGKPVLESPGLSGDANYAVKWLPGDNELVADDGVYLTTIDGGTGRRRIIAERQSGFVMATLSPDGKRIGAVMWNGNALILRRETDVVISEFETGITVGDGVRRLLFLPDRRLVTSARGNRYTDIWDKDGQVRQVSFEGARNDGVPLAVSPDGNWIATGGTNHSILLWDLSRLHI